MKSWALINRLNGNHVLVEKIQTDLKHQRSVESLLVLGDLLGPDRHCDGLHCDALSNRIQNPKCNDNKPDCVYGWWEEQRLTARGDRADRGAQACRLISGKKAINQRWMPWR